MIRVLMCWTEEYKAKNPDFQQEIIFDDKLDYLAWLARFDMRQTKYHSVRLLNP